MKSKILIFICGMITSLLLCILICNHFQVNNEKEINRLKNEIFELKQEKINKENIEQSILIDILIKNENN